MKENEIFNDLNRKNEMIKIMIQTLENLGYSYCLIINYLIYSGNLLRYWKTNPKCSLTPKELVNFRI